MPDKDPDGPSLELPSFGFGRKRKQRDAAPEPDPAPPEAGPAPEPEPATAPVPALAEPPVQPPQQTQPVEQRHAGHPAPSPEPATRALDPIAPPPAASSPTPPAEHATARQPRTTPLLGLGALPASLLTGVVVGLLTALLAYASQRLCEVVRSTSSCGGAGVLLLLAILVGMTLLGSALLGAFKVPEAGSSSVLAVGLLAALVLLFLIDAAFSPAMFVVIPLLAAGCYAAAHLVTTASTSTD